MAANLKTAAMNFFQSRKQDVFFFGIAVFALGIVARQEMMKKGILARPVVEDNDISPKVERKRRSE